MEKICILGGGAIGSCVSASLTEANLDVCLVDQWAAHIEKIRIDGLVILVSLLNILTQLLQFIFQKFYTKEYALSEVYLFIAKAVRFLIFSQMLLY